MARTAVAQFQNLVTKSQNAADALWTKSGLNASTPIVSNDAIGPDGTMTADRLVEDNSTAFHTVFRNTGAVIAPGVYTVSASLKEGTRRYGGVQIIVGTGLQRYFVLLDLRTGTVLGTSSTGSPTSTAYSVVSEGNGWYRLSVTALNPNVAAVYVCVAPSDSASPSYSASFPSYTGDNSSGIYATDYQVVCANWGGPKVKTTTTAVDTGNIRSVVAQSQNILPYSQNLDTWTASGCSITANTTDTLDPWGTNTAEILVEDSSTGTHRMQTIGGAQNIVIGSPLTVSVFVKAGTRSECYIQNSVGENMTVNLATGAIDAFTGGINRGVINAGNGWWRLWISFLAPATNASLYVYAGNPALSYTGTNLSKALYVAGAQYTRTNWLTPYVQTGATVLDRGNPRNIVSQKQNLLKYSEAPDNAAWTTTSATWTANNIANPIDGAVTAYKMTEASATAQHRFYSGIVYVSVTIGQTCTASVYVKAGTRNWCYLTQNDAIFAYFNLTTGLNGTVTSGTLTSTALANGWYRLSWTFQATTAAPNISFGLTSADNTSSGVGDGTGTMYFWGMQLARSNQAGPYVQTTTTTVDTGNIKGITAQQQNLIKYSNDITQSSWANDATSTLVTVSGVDPTGATSTFSRLTCAGGSLQYLRGSGYNPAVGVGSFTMSAWVKTVAGGTQTMRLKANSTAAAYSSDLTVTGTWSRISYTSTDCTGSGTCIVANNSANAALDVYLYDIQIVRGNWPGPACITTSSAIDTGNIRNVIL